MLSHITLIVEISDSFLEWSFAVNAVEMSLLQERNTFGQLAIKITSQFGCQRFAIESQWKMQLDMQMTGAGRKALAISGYQIKCPACG